MIVLFHPIGGSRNFLDEYFKQEVTGTTNVAEALESLSHRNRNIGIEPKSESGRG